MADVPVDASDMNPNMYLPITGDELTGATGWVNTGGVTRQTREDL